MKHMILLSLLVSCSLNASQNPKRGSNVAALRENFKNIKNKPTTYIEPKIDANTVNKLRHKRNQQETDFASYVNGGKRTLDDQEAAWNLSKQIKTSTQKDKTLQVAGNEKQLKTVYEKLSKIVKAEKIEMDRIQKNLAKYRKSLESEENEN